MKQQIILASASPRRKELLDQIGVSYLVYPVDIDETPKQQENPQDYVCRVAAEKSAACINSVDSALPVLAADTSVVLGEQIMGKPENREHAQFMLSRLSGQTHYVYSAVSFRTRNEQAEDSHQQALSRTEVRFRQIQPEEIQTYWETGEPLGKAGAYAIQGLGSVFVESIAGSFSGVVGLPLFETAKLLSKQGIKVLHE